MRTREGASSSPQRRGPRYRLSNFLHGIPAFARTPASALPARSDPDPERNRGDADQQAHPDRLAEQHRPEQRRGDRAHRDGVRYARRGGALEGVHPEIEAESAREGAEVETGGPLHGAQGLPRSKTTGLPGQNEIQTGTEGHAGGGIA